METSLKHAFSLHGCFIVCCFFFFVFFLFVVCFLLFLFVEEKPYWAYVMLHVCSYSTKIKISMSMSLVKGTSSI